ncbi:TonB-dependent receptor [Spirosoma arcticum]
MRLTVYVLVLNLFINQLQAQNAPTRSRTGTATISGYVRETGSREALIGVNVYLPGTTIGTTTNTYGFYSLTLPAQDSLRLAYSFVGFETVARSVDLRTNVTVDIALTPGRVLAAVDVRAGRTDEKVSESSQMSRIDIPVYQIKKIPAFLGEKDVLKVLQLMPGVQKGSEGQSGIYVRGGGPDQNLIILDDAIVYNANHLFGFFSTFNGDALKSVELIKGGFPAWYGGRLSSVIELNMKDGNREKLHGEGGIGLIASRLVLEGPLGKSRKGSFLVSARRTYIDVLTQPIIRASTDGDVSTGYYFYDLNAKMNYDLGQKDKVYLSGYFGQDRFYSRDKFNLSTFKAGLNWVNATGTFRWNHLFSEKLFANTSLTFSNYRFGISSDEEVRNQAGDVQQTSLRYTSGIRDFSLKYDADYYPNPNHSFRFGLQSTYHRFTPSAVVLRDTETQRFRNEVDNIDVIESGIYAEDTWRPTNQWRINGGFRLSQFLHRNVTYIRPEPRLSAAYVLRPGLSIKASYALMNQYVHLLSNTGIGLPTDLWVPTTDRFKPQQSHQVAGGLAYDFAGRTAFTKDLTLTVEGYYKRLSNIISYREGASFLLINDPESAETVRWEDNVTAGRGWSYGGEVLLQKKSGRFSGWVGYTLSWTRWQFPELNGGRPFFPRYDRRHDISLVGIYELSKRITLSGTWVYGTGQALTIPVANYTAYPHLATRPNNGFSPTQPGLINQLFNYGRTIGEYGERNGFRAEPYHRLDFGIQVHKKMKRHERTWEFSLYNAYSRRNPFFYLLDDAQLQQNAPSVTVLKRYSIFPIIPSFSYNFKF